MKKLLMTGFEPFGREIVNPSWLAVKSLPDVLTLPGSDEKVEIMTSQLPTVFNKSLEKMYSLIESYQPDVIIPVGQAGGRSAISVERIGINVDDAYIPDNDDKQPEDEAVIQGGPASLFATLPVKDIVQSIKKEEKIPAELSNSAGTYVCNHVMYGTLFYLHQQQQPAISGFIHVPFLPEQALDKPGKPYMSLDLISRGLIKAAQTACLSENN